MENQSLLAAKLSVQYGEKPVLHELTFEIQPGEILGLLGQSGSGKSTIALSLLQLLQYRGGSVQGSIRWQGRELIGLPERELRRIRGREMALIPQSPVSALHPTLSLQSQLWESWRAHSDTSKATAMTRIRETLRQVCLPDDDAFLRRQGKQLSGGQAQRVVIAMAVLHRPALLIADEATSSLDALTQAEILALFRQLRDTTGAAVLYISHDLLSVASLCDRTAILHEGSIVECGATEDLFQSPRHAYTRKLLATLPRLAATPETVK